MCQYCEEAARAIEEDENIRENFIPLMLSQASRILGSVSMGMSQVNEGVYEPRPDLGEDLRNPACVKHILETSVRRIATVYAFSLAAIMSSDYMDEHPEDPRDEEEIYQAMLEHMLGQPMHNVVGLIAGELLKQEAVAEFQNLLSRVFFISDN